MLPTLTVRALEAADLPAVLALQARVLGPGRFARTAYRVREGTPAITRYCLAALLDGALVATLRFTPITIGGVAGALLLGPLTVEPVHAGKGYGKRLVAEELENARQAGVALIVLVGDEPYYARFGFKRVAPGRIRMPGPVDAARLLAAELMPCALERYAGTVAADVAAMR